jgi:hypothetical protein
MRARLIRQQRAYALQFRAWAEDKEETRKKEAGDSTGPDLAD